jgi:hypothetical protein
MTQEHKEAWAKETHEALNTAVDTIIEKNKTIQRLLACNQRLTLACNEFMKELEQRVNCDPDTAWMNRHIINARNALPPTVSPALLKNMECVESHNDMPGLVFRLGVQSMKVAQAAYGG